MIASLVFGLYAGFSISSNGVANERVCTRYVSGGIQQWIITNTSGNKTITAVTQVSINFISTTTESGNYNETVGYVTNITVIWSGPTPVPPSETDVCTYTISSGNASATK